MTLTYDGATFEVTNQAAYDAAISAFCRYHRMRLEELETWNHRYILEHVYPCFKDAKNLNKVKWPC